MPASKQPHSNDRKKLAKICSLLTKIQLSRQDFCNLISLLSLSVIDQDLLNKKVQVLLVLDMLPANAISERSGPSPKTPFQ